MTKEREQTLGIFTPAKDLQNSLNFCWNPKSSQKRSYVYRHILKVCMYLLLNKNITIHTF